METVKKYADGEQIPKENIKKKKAMMYEEDIVNSKNVDLIILDEMSYVPFNTEGAELFFQLISDWYKKSLIITSNQQLHSRN